jgi:hypothetical protein
MGGPHGGGRPKENSMQRRRLLAHTAMLAAATWPVRASLAQDARVYAVMSLVADYLTVTGFESTTGSMLRLNQTERIDLQTDELERAVLRAALRVVNESGAGKAVPLLTDDGRLYNGQGQLLDGEQARLPAFLLDQLLAQKATHLLLVTKFNAVAKMRSADQDLGTGRVEGLGFYLDRVTPLRRMEGGDVAVGYLAPHAYLRLSLIDIAQGKVLRSKTLTASTVVSAAGSSAKGANPWDVMSSADKMSSLSELIAKATVPAWRELLGS